MLLSAPAFSGDTGLKSPTVSGTGSWTNPNNAFSSDNSYASGLMATSQIYSTFTLSGIGATIFGVEILIEANIVGMSGLINVDLSWNSGSTWTSTKSANYTAGAGDTVVTIGGSADTWGRSWSSSDFSDSNFRVRLTNSSATNISVDHVQARVTFGNQSIDENGGVFWHGVNTR